MGILTERDRAPPSDNSRLVTGERKHRPWVKAYKEHSPMDLFHHALKVGK